MRIAAPVCALVRNDMQKAVACQRLQGVVRNDMQKAVACQRLQGRWFAMTCRRRWRVSGCKAPVRNDMQKTEAFLRLQGGYRFFHRPVITRYTGGSVPLAAPHTAAVRRIFRWPAAMAPTVTL